MPCDLEFFKATIKTKSKNKSIFQSLSFSIIFNIANRNHNLSKNLQVEEIIKYIFQVDKGLSYKTNIYIGIFIQLLKPMLFFVLFLKSESATKVLTIQTT